MKLTHASVFSGIGGPEVAATMLGWDNLFHCEINPFGRAVLDYWYPNSKSYEDITKTDFTPWRGKVNVLTGGFPCQPFSYAGQRRGATDDRYLWPYMFRCIDQIRPDWVVAENVAGILTMVEQGEVSPMASAADLFDQDYGVRRYRLRETFTLQRICDDLTSHGYEVQPILIPACAVGAPHRRDRVFIVGRRIATNANDGADGRDARTDEGESRAQRLQERHEVRESDKSSEIRRENKGDDSADPSRQGLEGQDESGSGEGEQRVYLRRNVARHNRQDLRGRDAAYSKRIGWNTREYDNGLAYEPQQTERGELKLGRANRAQNRWRHFPTVPPVHRGNDGLPFPLDGLTISSGKWRTEALKAYGNAIVPQVMYEIFKAIGQTYQQ